MSELMQRLDNLWALMQTPEFLEGKGLSYEVNIRIRCRLSAGCTSTSTRSLKQ